MFGGRLRQLEETACNATECAAAILSGGSAARMHEQFDNVSDIPLMMIGFCSWPQAAVLSCPPLMHNLGHMLTDIYNYLWENLSYPVGKSRTLSKARCILRQRLFTIVNLSGDSSSWNITARRRLFSNWADIYDGLLADHLLVVPFMASVLSSELYSSCQINEFRLSAYIFGLMVLVSHCESSLYWHTTAAHLGPVLRQLRVSPASVCEESMEATFRPVKDWHRNRSNHQGIRDLQILRAVNEAHLHINKEYGDQVYKTNDWPVAIAMDLWFAPCVSGEP